MILWCHGGTHGFGPDFVERVDGRFAHLWDASLGEGALLRESGSLSGSEEGVLVNIS